jgi:hypothetical protein
MCERSGDQGVNIACPRHEATSGMGEETHVWPAGIPYTKALESEKEDETGGNAKTGKRRKLVRHGNKWGEATLRTKRSRGRA